MTIKELIIELQKYDENLAVEIQYRDGGGYYEGTDDPQICLDKRFNYYSNEIEEFLVL